MIFYSWAHAYDNIEKGRNLVRCNLVRYQLALFSSSEVSTEVTRRYFSPEVGCTQHAFRNKAAFLSTFLTSKAALKEEYEQSQKHWLFLSQNDTILRLRYLEEKDARKKIKAAKIEENKKLSPGQKRVRALKYSIALDTSNRRRLPVMERLLADINKAGRA